MTAEPFLFFRHPVFFLFRSRRFVLSFIYTQCLAGLFRRLTVFCLCFRLFFFRRISFRFFFNFFKARFSLSGIFHNFLIIPTVLFKFLQIFFRKLKRKLLFLSLSVNTFQSFNLHFTKLNFILIVIPIFFVFNSA